MASQPRFTRHARIDNERQVVSDATGPCGRDPGLLGKRFCGIWRQMRAGNIPVDCKDAQLCPARIADIKERYGRPPVDNLLPLGRAASY